MKIMVYMFMSIVLIIVVAGPANAEITLGFGLYASDKPSTLKKKFSPILRAIEPMMSQILGQDVKVKFVFSKTYNAGVQNLVNGRVDFVRFGPASYVEAKKANRGVTILAIETKKGKKTFNGIICVSDDSPLRNIIQLKGRSFAFGDKGSTIGRYLSQQYLVGHGIRASDLNKYRYLGGHKNVASAVARGDFDAGALKESTFKKMKRKGKGLRVLASFPNVTKPWIARAGLKKEIMQAITTSLLRLKDPKALKGLKLSGFVAGNDSDYIDIRFSIENNGDFFK